MKKVVESLLLHQTGLCEIGWIARDVTGVGAAGLQMNIGMLSFHNTVIFFSSLLETGLAATSTAHLHPTKVFVVVS